MTSLTSHTDTNQNQPPLLRQQRNTTTAKTSSSTWRWCWGRCVKALVTVTEIVAVIVTPPHPRVRECRSCNGDVHADERQGLCIKYT